MSSEDESDHSSHLASRADTAKLLNQQHKKGKRTRQRVDAGEPRNSYATVTNYSPIKPANDHALCSPSMQSSIEELAYDNFNANTSAHSGDNKSTTNNSGCFLRKQFSSQDACFLQRFLHQSEKLEVANDLQSSVSAIGWQRQNETTSNAAVISQFLKQWALAQSSVSVPPVNKLDKHVARDLADESELKLFGRSEMQEQQPDLGSTSDTCTITNSHNHTSSISKSYQYDEDSVQAKRARVDAIVTSMRMSPGPPEDAQECKDASPLRKPKRKQYIPQQQVFQQDSILFPPRLLMERDVLKSQLQQVQEQLLQMQQKYSELFPLHHNPEKREPGFLLHQSPGNKQSQNIEHDNNAEQQNQSTGSDHPSITNFPKSREEVCDNKLSGSELPHVSDNLDHSRIIDQARQLFNENDIPADKRYLDKVYYTDSELQTLAHALKAELVASVSVIIDAIVARFVLHVRSRRAAFSDTAPPPAPSHSSESMTSNSSNSPNSIPKSIYTKATEKPKIDIKCPILPPFVPPTAPTYETPIVHPPIPNGHPFYHSLNPYALYHSCGLPTPPPAPAAIYKAALHNDHPDPMSLSIPPKKKRHKVTDTRLSPRTSTRVNMEEPLHRNIDSPYNSVPTTLPTSVAILNPSLHENNILPSEDHSLSFKHMSMPHSPCYESSRGSPTPLSLKKSDYDSPSERSGSGEFAPYDQQVMAQSVTLTPMHLRKAKLMFFYVRYPSSAILKMYFPDIQFNRSNTAQLVKWFSNFREFFYIQMEKYARQAISEGTKAMDDIIVARDSEIFRVLNLHYNRNNHIEAPENFRKVVEITLKEFFRSVSIGKDSEQSWKKQIYKVIARLDDNIPEYFMTPNFLEQLE